ncbi:VanZ family protein [Aliiglaciecola sp. LCG003]|uniref:VanZ family protein n=1 Tax=Aliiglaciecola sp. LCG003 TaxID=3053655 RepID=UPI002573DE91|nr:VanZ family protein [Aliiglaciecola sp. LCG003]WJG08320.1 VanZ family protein [Aliiglaciecola sp. LCG003]
MNLVNHRRLMYWLAALVFGIFLLLMFVPVEYIPVDTRSDKLLHALLFVLITLVAKPVLKCPLWMLVIGLTLFAVLSEVAQHFIPYRSGSLDDFYADLTGITLACALLGGWSLVTKLYWRFKR